MALINLKDFYQLEMSLTQRCRQYGWGSKYYYPCCPKETGIIPLEDYFKNLNLGDVFAYNDDSPKLIILEFVKLKINSSILIMCEREGIMSEAEHFQPWLIAEIKYENGFFIHSKLGSYFESDNATNEFFIKQE